MPGARCDPSMRPPPRIASPRVLTTAARGGGVVSATTDSLARAGIGTTDSVPGLGFRALEHFTARSAMDSIHLDWS